MNVPTTYKLLRQYIKDNQLPIKTSHITTDKMRTLVLTYLGSPMPIYTREMLIRLTRKQLLEINKMYQIHSGNKKTSDLINDILNVKKKYTKDELDTYPYKELRRIAFVKHITPPKPRDEIIAVLTNY